MYSWADGRDGLGIPKCVVCDVRGLVNIVKGLMEEAQKQGILDSTVISGRGHNSQPETEVTGISRH